MASNNKKEDELLQELESILQGEIPGTSDVETAAEADDIVAEESPAEAESAAAADNGEDEEEGKVKVDLADLESELKRERYKSRYMGVVRSTIYTLITVAAVAILIATLWMPVLQIYGTSMSPTLTDGDIVVSRKTANLKQGDVVAFYYNNRILVKRFIAGPGDWVDIDDEGNVYVNGVVLDEPYVSEKSLGETNIDLPYQVPESRIFVMGDHRSVSIDSRNSSVGCVSDEQIVGELIFKVWPLQGFGLVK